MQLHIKRLTETAIIPKYAHSNDSGMDLHYSGTQVTLQPRCRLLLETGIAIQLPSNTEAQLRSRSGLTAKKGVIVLNSPATIDEGYTGELKIVVYNSSDEPFVINPGDRIAQMVIAPVLRPQIAEVDQLAYTDRGNNGFGSTGLGAK